MAVTGGWTERTFGSAVRGRPTARPARRSLGAALREAGLGDAAPDARDEIALETASRSISDARLSSAIATSRSPRLAVFDEPDEPAPLPRQAPPQPQTTSVVSPPPWLRAARRGRWQARMLNAFGWVMMLTVAGSIIGVAGRYLAVPPLGVATMQARP